MPVSNSKRLRVALTIAGSDSGGGAGIQADLKAFAALGVHGATAITCLTAQNPARVRAIQPCRPEMVRQQIEAVFEELAPAAVKTGMLHSAGIARIVVEWFRGAQGPALVVDPVMIATSGARLMARSLLRILTDQLLPLATLVTPNLDEAGLLLGRPKPRSVEEMRAAARDIHDAFGCAALVKGGHLVGVKEAIDVLYDGRSEFLLQAAFVRGVVTHGTGCTYSAAITAGLARGRTLAASVKVAKEHISQAIAGSYSVGAHQALNNFWR